MAYDSFAQELRIKSKDMVTDINEIQELDGKVLVEYFGDPVSPPGSGFCGCHGLSVAGVLDEKQAAEADAEPGYCIAVFK